MARIVVTAPAVESLGDLIQSRSLPASARARVRQTLTPLATFPEMGATAEQSLAAGALGQRRFILGPWRWMIIIYSYAPDRDVVTVLEILDGRTSDSPLASR